VKFPRLVSILKPLSAEEILLEANPQRWKEDLAKAYASTFMAKRMAKEMQGTKQIKDGTYTFI